MPLDAWLLLGVAVFLGLGLELAFFRAQRRRTRERQGRSGGQGDVDPGSPP